MKMSLTKLFTLLGGNTQSRVYRLYADYMEGKRLERRRKILQDKGVTILSAFHDACNEAGVRGWLDFGTLLGAYREKEFITHDYDLDVGMMSDDYNDDFKKCMKNRGFVLDHEFVLVNRNSDDIFLCEVTYKYDSFPLDVFFSRMDGNIRQCYVFIIEEGLESDERAVNLYEFDAINDVEKVMIHGNEFNAPNNPDKVLENVYGPNFMIPDPNWQTASPQNKRVRRLDYNEFYGKCRSYNY